MDRDEEAARRVLSEHNGSELFEPFVAALRAAREEERARCAEIARTVSEGYGRHHCQHCRDGEIAASNVAYFINRPDRFANQFPDAIESGSERVS